MTTFEPWDMMSLVDAPVRYDLAQSTSAPSLRVDDLLDADQLASVALGYGGSRGRGDLRALIGAEAGVDAEQVLVTVGAASAMFLLAQDSCRPGDHVLVLTPCFPRPVSCPRPWCSGRDCAAALRGRLPAAGHRTGCRADPGDTAGVPRLATEPLRCLVHR